LRLSKHSSNIDSSNEASESLLVLLVSEDSKSKVKMVTHAKK
jgi:hypothetical protein